MRGSEDRPAGYRLAIAAVGVAGFVDVGGALPAGLAVNAGLAVLGTVLVGLAALLGLTARGAALPARLVALPLGAALPAWAVVGLAVYGPTREGVQSLMVLLGFLLAVEATHILATRWPATGPGLTRTIEVAVLPASLWSLGQSAGVLPLLLGDRTFALAVLPAFLVNRFASTLRPSASRWLGVLYLAAVALSLSRTVTALMVLIVVVAELSRPRGQRWRALAALGVIGVGGVGAVVLSASLRQRLFDGDRSLAVGDVVINTSGRTNLWATVARGIVDRPWLGHGIGTSVDLVERTFVTIMQVHNDYLRLLYDLGILGLLFWLVLVVGLGVAARTARRHAPPSCLGPASAVTALVVMSLAMTTDNVLVYAFVLLPFGALLGLHLAPAGAEVHRESPRRAQLLHTASSQRGE